MKQDCQESNKIFISEAAGSIDIEHLKSEKEKTLIKFYDDYGYGFDTHRSFERNEDENK